MRKDWRYSKHEDDVPKIADQRLRESRQISEREKQKLQSLHLHLGSSELKRKSEEKTFRNYVIQQPLIRLGVSSFDNQGIRMTPISRKINITTPSGKNL